MFQHGLHQQGHQKIQTHGAGVVADSTVVVFPGFVTPGPPASVVLEDIVVVTPPFQYEVVVVVTPPFQGVVVVVVGS